MAYLEIRTASGDVTTKPLSKSQPLSIGSHASNDLRITDEGVATMHCRIGWNGNAYEVTAALPEGVDVNGTLVERASLSAGDILLVGRTDVVYQAEESSDLGLKPLSDDEISLRRTRPTSQKPASPGPEAPPAMETSGKSRPGSKSPAGAPRSAKRESRQPAASKSPSAPRSESAEPSRAGGASADEPWDPVIGDESPSQVIHRSTTFATSAAEGEGARRTKSPVSRIRALWRSHPARPGEQDVLRSPFILSLGGGTLLLFFIGAIFWFIIARDTAKRQFNAAMSLVNEKSYSQAIQSFDKFLENYPRHKLTQQALEERGKAKIEMEIMGSTQSWARGMKALDEFIQYRRDDPGFSKLHKLVSQYAETIALGAARSAGETKDRSLLEISSNDRSLVSPADRAAPNAIVSAY